MSNLRGRQVVVSLTNKSGGSVAAGDVVIVDTGNNEAITTTTSARVEVSLGVVQEAIASNATGRVLVHGYAALVNVPSSVTRGHYVETHTVAKQATGNSSRRSGSFGQFLTGGTTPTALIWGRPDQTASGGSTNLPFKSATSTAAGSNQTVTSTFAALFSSQLSLSIAAAVDDWLKIELTCTNTDSNGQLVFLDFALNGSRIGDSSNGIYKHFCHDDVGNITHYAVAWHKVVSGDRSGGNVPVVPQVKHETGTQTTILYNTPPAVMTITNLGVSA